MVASPRASGSGSHGDTRAWPGFAKSLKLETVGKDDISLATTSESPSPVVSQGDSLLSDIRRTPIRSTKQILSSVLSKRRSPSMVTEPRGLGSGKKPKVGDSSGSSNAERLVDTASLDQTLGGGGSTCHQPGNELQSLNCVAPGCRLPNLALRSAPEVAIARADGQSRLVSSSRRVRIATKRPPSAAECLHASKRRKRDSG